MNDDIDDVMGFNEEPEYDESSLEEPVIPEGESYSVAEDQHKVEPSQQNVGSNSDYEGYEDWEESDGSGVDLVQSQLEAEDNKNNSSERTSSLDNNNQNDEQEEYDERSQSQKILDSEPSVKETKVSKKTNKGTFFNRSKILTLLAFIFVAFVLFFSFIFPMITEKKQKKEAEELNKNGKTYIPQVLQEEIPPTVPSQQNNVDFSDSNSALQTQNEENISNKYPAPVNSNNNTAPVSVPSSSSSTSSDFPITNRNEQQKSIQRLSLDSTTSPTETQKAKYPTKTLTGYNTGYNSGYSGTSTTPTSYTPKSLEENINKIYSQQQGMGVSSYEKQNNQSQKEEFIKKNGLGGQFQWNAEYSLWKGTIISVVLDTGINTDLPGQILGHVTKNIYSSQDGKYLLIPQGSRLFGEYSSQISYGQTRVQVVWNTLIRPDGLEINLGSMNGIDANGMSGYKGFRTEHPFEYAKAFGLIAAYSILDTKAMNLIDAQNNMYAQNALSDVYGETKKLNNEIVERAMDIQPTIRIKSGTEVNLITNVTIDLPPLEPYEVDGKYVRY